MKKLAIALLLFFLSSQTWGQVNAQYNSLSSKLEAYVNHLAPEKLYLHTDKDFYINGDTIWFKAYLLNGVTHATSSKSKVIYVDLLNSKDSVVIKRKLYIDGSSVFGDIKIDDSIKEGDYHIRAYTVYMLNDENLALFQKNISILARPLPLNGKLNDTISKNTKEKRNQNKDVPHLPMKKPNVQFFPEGGNLVAGLQSKLALKITDESGNGIALKGNIMDLNGVVIARFETHNFGLGSIPITPKIDTGYYAEIHVNGIRHTYRLPTALKEGYVVQLINKGSKIIIKVSTNSNVGLTGTLLLGHLRGDIFLKHAKEYRSKKSYTITFPTSTFSDGVAHFTLFDQQGEPICERLTFIDNPENGTDLILKTDKPDYRFREKAEIEMSLFDTHGKPILGDFSISVALDNSLEKNTSSIKSWLLLNSDIGHTNENPNYFFEEDSLLRKNLLDILMLTHGWRRFVWKSFLQDNLNLAPEFHAEKGITINGRTTAFGNPYQPKRSTATLSILGPEIYQEKITTDDQGKFIFGPFVFQDSVRAIINATAPFPNKKSNRDLAVYIDSFPSTVNITDPTGQRSQKTTIVPQEDFKQAYRNTLNDFEYSPQATALSEVVVTAKKKTRKERIEEELDKMTIHGSAQNRLFPDSTHGLVASATVFDLIRRVAGVQVFGTSPNQSVSIRGISSISSSGDPLFTIDGVPTSTDFVRNLTINDVLFVDVLKGNEAAIYGARGTNGVVAIYTDRGQRFESTQENYPGVANFVVQGFYRAREFYSPNYSVNKPEHQRPDYRTTLYWNPEVVINRGTPTKLYFYTGDVAGKYTINIEGLTADGNPIRKQYSFNVFE